MKTSSKLLLAIIAIYVILQLVLFIQLKQLPSPLFGGDYYHSQGQIIHSIDGGSPFDSSHEFNAVPHYMPMYTSLVMSVSLMLPFFTTMQSMFFTSLIIMVGAISFSFLFFRELFDNDFVGLVSMLVFLPLQRFPIWKYMDFTMVLIYPMFLYFLLQFYRKNSWVNAFNAGVTLGILGISHSVGFVGMIFFIGAFTLISVFKNKDKIKYLLKTAFMGVCALPIALLYWWRPIFEFHATALNPLHELDFVIFDTVGKGLSFFGETVSYYFLGINAANALSFVLSIVCLAGFGLLIFKKNIDNNDRFILYFLLSVIVTVFHYFVTLPIIGTSFSPQYMKTFFFPIVVAIGVGIIIKNLVKKEYIIIAIITLLVLVHSLMFVNYINTDRWVSTGKADFPHEFQETAKWVRTHTDVDDVFLSTNELAFTLNGLTGRKTTTLRKGHTGIFIDSDNNMLETAIMLYGNDTDSIKKLLKENRVKYLYWNERWLSLEFTFNEGKLVDTYDPLIVLKNDSKAKVLNDNGVEFFMNNQYIDPAARIQGIKTFDVMVVVPESFDETPWSDELDSMLNEIWSYQYNGHKTSRIYEVNYDN